MTALHVRFTQYQDLVMQIQNHQRRMSLRANFDANNEEANVDEVVAEFRPAYEATAPDVLAELTSEALDFKQAPDMQTRLYFKEARDKHEKLLGVVKDDYEKIDAKLRAAIPEIARIAKESVADGRRRGQVI